MLLVKLTRAYQVHCGRGVSAAVTAFLLLACLAAPTYAQTVGTCSHGEAEADLDIANVRARMFNKGNLFWHAGSPVYEVPKDSGMAAIFVTNLWIGGQVDGEIRVSASNYHDWEMWPGPLDDAGNPPADCAPYDRIYKVSDEDIRLYNERGEVTTDMADWPVTLGAPVVDGDGIAGNYNLAAGDRPRVYGDQTLWWLMNDAGNRHETTESQPLGLEVRVAAFAFDDPMDSWFDDATFYLFDVINRSPNTIDSLFFGFHSDPDVGDAGDDFVGGDSLLGLGYAYNGDNMDGGSAGYRDRPAAIGYDLILGPVVDDDEADNDFDGAIDEVGEMLPFTSFMTFSSNTGVSGTPMSLEHYYYYLQSRWKDGTPITYGGVGRSYSTTPVPFMFSGDPPNFWSEDQPTPGGRPHVPSDRRFVIGSGPLQMVPGQSERFLLAILFARSQDRLKSVQRLKQFSRNAQSVSDRLLRFDTTAYNPGTPEPVPRLPEFSLHHYPMPSAEIAVIEYEILTEMDVRVRVFDVAGREVRTLIEGVRSAGEHEAVLRTSDLPSGMYFYRLESEILVSETKQLVVIR